MTANHDRTVRNILRLEQQRHYDDGAVVGGLAAFLVRVGSDLHLSDELWRQVRAYREAAPADRAAVVAGVLHTLDQPAPAGPARAASPPDGGQAAPSQQSGLGRSPSPPPGATRSAPPSPAPAPRPTAVAGSAQPAASASPAPPTPPSTPARARPVPRVARLAANASVAALPGVGPARAGRLASLGIETVGHLRFHFPHRYLAYPPPQAASALGFQHLASFEGEVGRVDVAPLPGRRVRITAVLGDATGTVAAVWIRSSVGPPGSARLPGVSRGARLAVSGPLVAYGRQVYFENPEYEAADDPPLNTRRMVPVYPLASGLSQGFLRALVRQALESLPPLEELLPAPLRAAEGLLGRDEAVRELHQPTSDERLDAARTRFAFDELLPIQLLVLQRRLAYQGEAAEPIGVPWALLAEFRQQLPFALTGAQQRVLSAVLEDMARPRPMLRLLQGEVGSGKTVVAAMAVLAAIASGGQAAILAPTEILAEQHHRTLSELYGARPALEAALGRPLQIELLTGATSRGDRQRLLAALAAGETDLLVGTHAVIQADVEFARLVLAVVDEQHRFGVNQRVALRRKGVNPHLLVMTATPIPRTLALTLYGDLDVAIIDELPAGRQPIATTLLTTAGRAEAYEAVRAAVAAGHQAFVICPLVEDSPAREVRAATTEYHRLQEGELAGLRLALLHGRMRPAEKDDIMRAFARRDADVLIATSVVEVGIDIPNATVMVVEGAERFGLAQLHQFRGRVGRGSAPAACFLIAGSEAPESLERLEAVARSTNGLELAEEDLRTRGPGDYFGLRQSGLPSLRMARLTDLAFVQRVRAAAAVLLEQDPALEDPANGELAAALTELSANAGEAN